MLERMVVVIDPMLNPDGLARFASWGEFLSRCDFVSDPNTLEHNQSWPSGRGNHYWFDLNRDWLWLQHPESQAHVATFQQWRPHIFSDFHEQGTNATYFFQPGVPTRTHPLTPQSNQDLTVALQNSMRKPDARGEFISAAKILMISTMAKVQPTQIFKAVLGFCLNRLVRVAIFKIRAMVS